MGKNVLPTLMKLALASLVVGTVLAVIGLDPFDLWEGLVLSIVETVEQIFGVGWNGFLSAARYMLIGAVVVVPIWLISALFKRRDRDA